MRVVRRLIHFIQLVSLSLFLVLGEQIYLWVLALSTLAMFVEILTDKGEKIATPMEVLRSLEEAEVLTELSRK